MSRYFYESKNPPIDKRKNGEFIGAFAVYGYQKSPRNKNQLVIDEYAADIIRMIFKWKIDGESEDRDCK